MIGLDTNVLIRYLVQDNPDEAAKANDLVERRLRPTDPGFVSLIVVCEIAWVLKSAYRQTGQQIRHALQALLDARQLEFEESDMVATAIAAEGDIADALIAARALGQGCSALVTFDQRLAQRPGVELLS